MPKTNYIPRADSLPCSVVNFFRNNSDEQLTIDDIAEKFDTGRGNVHTNLRLAVEAGLLNRSKNEDGEYVYTAGKSLAAATVMQSPPADKPGKPASAARTHELLDLSEVVIEPSIPVPCRAGEKSHQLNALLTRLRVGESCALPLHTRPVLAKLVSRRHGTTPQRFVVRTIAVDQIRLWRTV
jgi:DNA-binding MarR family transcriptional regulator